jgi:hypothetical protein
MCYQQKWRLLIPEGIYVISALSAAFLFSVVNALFQFRMQQINW